MKFIKYLLYFFVAIAIMAIGVFLIYNKKIPTGSSPEKADALALIMQTSLNKQAWDSTNYVAWTFKGVHDFVWDKKNQFVYVKWEKNEAYLNLKDWQKGKAFQEGKEIKDAQLDVLRGKAWALFCNDSYWLIAPFKVFDEGVTRKIVINDDKSESLLVTYNSGGVTPGDSYLWKLDKNGVPISYQMWVKIIPIGGVESTWEGWKETQNKFKISTLHQLGPLKLTMENIKSGNDLSDLNLKNTFFDSID